MTRPGVSFIIVVADADVFHLAGARIFHVSVNPTKWHQMELRQEGDPFIAHNKWRRVVSSAERSSADDA
jgi:hypothetical protein